MVFTQNHICVCIKINNKHNNNNLQTKDDDVSLTLSPVIVGSVLTIVIISLAIALKIFMMTFLHNLRRNRQHGTKATATSVVAQTGDVYKVCMLLFTSVCCVFKLDYNL